MRFPKRNERTNMKVQHIDSIAQLELPGLRHQTLAARADGISSFEIWRQSLGPGAATPLHRHACEEVIVFTGGTGVIRFEGKETPVQAGTVLQCQPNELHQIINTGQDDLSLYGVLAISPVNVVDEHGETIALPW
jgi:mannose-6-phosphate isomerase-like protein (cupin superfamily)